MGPYCNFCNHRCFTYLPADTPPAALAAYGTSTIIATCREGQRFEKQRLGWCYDDIQSAIRQAQSAAKAETNTESEIDWTTPMFKVFEIRSVEDIERLLPLTTMPTNNPLKRPWATTPSGQLKNCEGVTLLIFAPNASPEVHEVIEQAPLQRELLIAITEQPAQSHPDETELLQALEACTHALSALIDDPMPDDGHGRLLRHGAALTYARALIARHRGE